MSYSFVVKLPLGFKDLGKLHAKLERTNDSRLPKRVWERIKFLPWNLARGLVSLLLSVKFSLVIGVLTDHPALSVQAIIWRVRENHFATFLRD